MMQKSDANLIFSCSTWSAEKVVLGSPLRVEGGILGLFGWSCEAMAYFLKTFPISHQNIINMQYSLPCFRPL